MIVEINNYIKKCISNLMIFINYEVMEQIYNKGNLPLII